MPAGGPRDEEVYLEFVVVGSVVKATAIHVQSGIEATVMGPTTATRHSLEKAALRKLEYLLKKQQPKP